MNYLGLVKRFIILVALSLILFSCGGGSDSKDPLVVFTWTPIVKVVFTWTPIVNSLK
ncbi:MAG: hypothetical protein ACI808_002206 [Paraglaciecola sp.]|jgi:hypothetical protein